VTAEQVAIVVLNWNRAAEAVACLESLRQADLGGASVLVVDNGSRDGSVETIRRRFPELRVIALPENRGYAGGNNAGIREALEAGAEGVLLLNNDTRVAPDFLVSLLDAMDSSPDCGAVTSAVHRLDRPDMLDVAYTEVNFGVRHAVKIRGVNKLVWQGWDRRLEVPVVTGCSLLLKAEALRTVGLFDEAYFAYHEDVDWCLRARKAGYRFFYEPFSRVYHEGGASTRGFHPRPPPLATDEPDLPEAEPTPWNPVRAYLGARNLVRLLRAYATEEQRRHFVVLCRKELPLEFMGVVMGREGWMTLGRWNWQEFRDWYFIRRHAVLRRRPTGIVAKVMRAIALPVLVPVDLCWSLPRDLWRAWRSGRTREFCEYVRGLVDGYFDRPLPLKRLGLR